MLTAHETSLQASTHKINELQLQYDQQLKTDGQLVPATSQTKCQLAKTYFQQATLLASQHDYRQAVLFYYEASQLTNHYQSTQILFDQHRKHTTQLIKITKDDLLTENPEQLFLMALQHLSGLGVPRDDNQAKSLLENLDRRGHAEAQRVLGLMYKQERAGPAKGAAADVEAVRHHRLAADQGHAAAQTNLGWMYQEGRAGLDKGAVSDAEAVRYFRLAVEQGDAIAQNNLGWMYKQGRAGLSKGAEANAEAVRYYRLAADQGHAVAQNILGVMYKEGRAGLDKGAAADVEAVRYHRLAADQGHAAAQTNLGWMCQEGLAGLFKGEASNVEAVYWYRLAVEQGDAIAQNNLGWMYKQGRAGLPKGLDANAEAVRYHRLAVDQGSAAAQANLDRIPNSTMKKSIQALPIGILKETVSWSVKEILTILNGKSLSDEMVPKLLAVLMSIEGEDCLALLPKERTPFMTYISAMLQYTEQLVNNQDLKMQYAACLKKCIHARIATPSITRGIFHGKSTAGEPFQELLDKVGRITAPPRIATSSIARGIFHGKSTAGEPFQELLDNVSRITAPHGKSGAAIASAHATSPTSQYAVSDHHADGAELGFVCQL